MAVGFFAGFKAGFQSFGHSVTCVVNFVLLSIVYMFGVGPTAILSKLKRKKFLDMEKPDPNKATYYKDLNLGKEPKENYYRQF